MTIVNNLASTEREEDVKHFYRELIGGENNWKYIPNSDGIWNKILFEFKHDLNGSRFSHRKALAQACYYLRDSAEVTHVVVADKNHASILTRKHLEDIYLNEKAIDWSLPASDPDRYLIGLLNVAEPYITCDMTQEEGTAEFAQEARDIARAGLGF